MRAHAGNRRFRSRPEIGRCSHALRFGGHPDWLAEKPSCITHRRIAAGRKSSEHRIAHHIGCDAVMLRIETSDQRVVIRKGLGRERRNEAFSVHAVGGEFTQPSGHRTLQVVPAKSVERNEHDAICRRGGRSMRDTKACQQGAGCNEAAGEMHRSNNDRCDIQNIRFLDVAHTKRVGGRLRLRLPRRHSKISPLQRFSRARAAATRRWRQDYALFS